MAFSDDSSFIKKEKNKTMSAPFHFPTEYGRMGNWPGSIGPNQAQALLIEAVTHKAGAKFVELGFDGGRTTIALNWAIRDLADAHLFVAPVMNDETGLWFRRAQILHRMDSEKVTGHETLEPFSADLIVMNPAMPFAHRWVELAPAGASIAIIGKERGDATGMQEVLSQPGITIWKKLAGPSHAIERAISSVVDEFSENKPGGGFEGKTVLLDSNHRAKIHSLRRGKERPRDGDSADTKVHAPVDADQGSELLSS